jgi:hypothetical protein
MAGRTFSHTFEESGKYPYFCMVHPWMEGVVFVGKNIPPPSTDVKDNSKSNDMIDDSDVLERKLMGKKSCLAEGGIFSQEFHYDWFTNFCEISSLTVNSGETLTIVGYTNIIIPESGNGTNRGTIIIENRGTLSNHGTLTNWGKIEIIGNFGNHNLIHNQGILKVDKSGWISVEEDAAIYNSERIENKGIFWNEGRVYNFCDAKYLGDSTGYSSDGGASGLLIRADNPIIDWCKETQSPSKEQSTSNSSEEGGGCLIATATYGSELAPQVQNLRELRDNKLLQTESGSAFITGFNDLYYSFSPTIADYERENPYFKEGVKLAIIPMISSLSILNHVDMETEAEVLGYGISLILLNVGVYVGVPVALVVGIRKF